MKLYLLHFPNSDCQGGTCLQRDETKTSSEATALVLVSLISFYNFALYLHARNVGFLSPR